MKVQPKNYTEEDRLAYTVYAIEQECQLAPVGAFRMITCHELRYNEQFKGVKASQFSLNSFRFFRYPHQVESRKKIGQSIFIQKAHRQYSISICLITFKTNTFGLRRSIHHRHWEQSDPYFGQDTSLTPSSIRQHLEDCTMEME